MEDDRLTSFVTFVLFAQVAMAILNFSGMFTVGYQYEGFAYSDIEEHVDDLKSRSEAQLGIVDYTLNLMSLVWLGFTIMISFVLTIFTCIPALLELFWIPTEIAWLFGFIVDALVLLSIGNRIFDRGA